MALIGKIDEHVIENLREFLLAADILLKIIKHDFEGEHKKDDGRLGAPAALLLFSIVDAIGSYHRKNRNLAVSNYTQNYIDGDGYRHFFILNSQYFNQDLSYKEVQFLYDKYRSPLSHNAAISNGILFYDDKEPEPFPLKGSSRVVNLHAFYEAAKAAVNKFIKESQAVIPQSRQAKGIKRAPQGSYLTVLNRVVPPSGYAEEIVFIDEDESSQGS